MQYPFIPCEVEKKESWISFMKMFTVETFYKHCLSRNNSGKDFYLPMKIIWTKSTTRGSNGK